MNSNWTRDDGATAQYDAIGKQMIFYSKAMLAALAAAQKADAAQKAQGL